MSTKRMLLLAAYMHVKEKRPVVRPNATFCNELRSFEQQVFGQYTRAKLHKRDFSLFRVLDWRNAIDDILGAAVANTRAHYDGGR
jgi:hypothetical protein